MYKAVEYHVADENECSYPSGGLMFTKIPSPPSSPSMCSTTSFDSCFTAPNTVGGYGGGSDDSTSEVNCLEQLEETLLQWFERDQIRDFKRTFRQFDKDGDGHIQTKELRAALRHMGQNPTDSDLQNIFNEMDIDRNGTIEFPEFIKMLVKSYDQENDEEDLRAAFEVFDTEGYGFVEINEIKELLCNLDETLTCAEQDEILAKVGKIEGGKITYEQFIQLLTWT